MSGPDNRALLPAGLRDVLPPDAEREADTVERLLAHCAGFGYERVKPPLLEFEEGLLSGAGASATAQAFRLMDPLSQRMMALRPDMTIQVARIAASRLAAAPRPLRLSYAGQVLRARGDQLQPERQFNQAGLELIGPASPAADAEVVSVTVGALEAVGARDLSIDFNLPGALSAIAADAALPEGDLADLRAALDRKDREAVAAAGGAAGRTLAALMDAAGPADAALSRLRETALPAAARADSDHLAEVVAQVAARCPSLTLSVDPVDFRGFEYHETISFSLFSLAARGELGRGGRYRVEGEPATGFSLAMDRVLRALPPSEPRRRALVAASLPADATLALRREGWATIATFEAEADRDTLLAEAHRLGCTHLVTAEGLEAIPPAGDGNGE
ncbi:MAG: ATP phosphoribosyltransferase regulatory subunit [Acetobacterales bacterium]